MATLRRDIAALNRNAFLTSWQTGFPQTAGSDIHKTEISCRGPTVAKIYAKMSKSKQRGSSHFVMRPILDFNPLAIAARRTSVETGSRDFQETHSQPLFQECSQHCRAQSSNAACRATAPQGDDPANRGFAAAGGGLPQAPTVRRLRCQGQ
jgi:hypothetical protein